MSKLRSIIFVALFIFFITSLTRNLLGYYKNISFYDVYRRKFNEEDKRNRTLKTQLLKEKDPHEIEKTIRNDLNLSKPNEVVAIIPSATPTPTIFLTPTLPVYQEWVKTFFNN